MPPKTRKLPSYCTSCGQPVEGEAAAKAANPSAAFCCECGVRLKQDGTCRNPACPWMGEIPKCS